mmetsp:Transcript_17116/g.37218  ORF Transcript_17116/g.37218 Transcript_17116/m.37218 type:complete len:561 (+) Transcript_17116:42-1724(+)
MASAQRAFRSRDDYKKSKELEEARKAGQVAPERDEEGNDINPHIPQYIANAPWYLGANAPSLKHQKANNKPSTGARGAAAASSSFEAWYPRGADSVAKHKPPTGFKKGACANCGATTHTAKSCLERPRAKGAKYSGRGIRPDDVVAELELDWEGKRDRWNGYDSRAYQRVVERHETLEQERREVKQAALDGKNDAVLGARAEGNEQQNERNRISDDGEYKLKADGEVIAHEKDVDTKGTARNLRIREDTAKYLRNLDLNSAYYDPKSRSMRQDPTPEIAAGDKDYAGDNFVRYSGDVKRFAQLELHALKAGQEGRDVPHLQADPSLAEMLHQEYQKRRDKLERARQDAILEKYGSPTQDASIPGEARDAEAADAVVRTALEQEQDRALELDPALLEQSEAYVEYTPDGVVVAEDQKNRHERKLDRFGQVRSRYDEDKFENNHTSIWGSFFSNGEWGFACCHSLIRRSYCTGADGIAAASAARAAVSASRSAPRSQPVIGRSESDREQNLLGQTGTSRKRARDDAFRLPNGENAEELNKELETFRRNRQRFEDPMIANKQE